MAWPPALPLDNGHAQSVVICAILFPTISTLCVAGRFASRKKKKVSLGADDWVTLPALLAVYAQMVIILLSVYYGGVGHHIDALTEENLVAFYKLIAAVQFSFGTSLGLAKISICLLLIRIFIYRSFRRHALPMHSIWKLQTSLSTKIGLSAIFALGFCDIIVAILRIIYLANTDFSPNSDFTWDSTGTYVWSVIESSLGVTVACTPVLRPLFYPWLPSLKSSIYSLAGSFTWKRRHENEAYSDISNGEMPLRDLAATFNTGTVAGANAGTLDPTYEEGSEPHSIHVKSEVSVRSLGTSSGRALTTV